MNGSTSSPQGGVQQHKKRIAGYCLQFMAPILWLVQEPVRVATEMSAGLGIVAAADIVVEIAHGTAGALLLA